MEARILAVADIYDALTTTRRYRKAMSPSKAVAILREEAADGKLDISVVSELVGIIDLNETPGPFATDCGQHTSSSNDADAVDSRLASPSI